MVAAAAVEAEHGDTDVTVGTGDLRPRARGERHGADGEGGGFEERTTTELIHGAMGLTDRPASGDEIAGTGDLPRGSGGKRGNAEKA
jgi:hypothetical protein